MRDQGLLLPRSPPPRGMGAAWHGPCSSPRLCWFPEPPPLPTPRVAACVARPPLVYCPLCPLRAEGSWRWRRGPVSSLACLAWVRAGHTGARHRKVCTTNRRVSLDFPSRLCCLLASEGPVVTPASACPVVISAAVHISVGGRQQGSGCLRPENGVDNSATRCGTPRAAPRAGH